MAAPPASAAFPTERPTRPGSPWALLPLLVALLLLVAPSALGQSTPYQAGSTCSGCPDIAQQQTLQASTGCSCHTEQEPWIHHPVELEPSPRLAGRIPAWLPLYEGKLTCTTCHEVEQVCAPDSPDPHGVRGGPWPARYSSCYACHDQESYERFNLHEMLDSRGRFIQETCLYCHTTVPGRAYGRQPLRLVDDIDGVCWRCHAIERHPAGEEHLVTPSERMRERIEAMEEEYHVRMPLSEDGQVSCVTCHNAHQRGVIPHHLAQARGSDEVNRLRIPRIMCGACHER